MREYNFENLVLLIGTNPLPNYVTADFFLQINPNIHKIWLIYSKENELQGGTFIYADNLEKLLVKKWKKERPALKFSLEQIGLSDVSRAGAIQKEIETPRLKEEIQNGGTFHLNYTGATKAMSIHVYRLLHEMVHERNISFSYLDARNFRLIDDKDNQIIEMNGERDLRKIVSLSFEDMIELHGYQLIINDNDDSSANDNDDSSAIELFKEYIDSKTTEERKKEIKQKQAQKLGKGLEKSVALKLKGIVKELNLTERTDLKQNAFIKYPRWTDGRHKFEIDIVLVEGYQLNGISCTVSASLPECKKRGFEIILRTRQIGGDESRSVLITDLNEDQTEWLQQQLITDTGGNTKNIKVFGIEDLEIETYLLTEFKNFIFSE